MDRPTPDHCHEPDTPTPRDSIGPDRARLTAEAADGNLSPEARVAEVELWGVRAVLVYRLDESEHARRTAVSAGPLADLWLLDALLKLPIGHAVGRTSLSGRDQRLLARGQRTHAYEQRGQTLIRKAVPPLTVDLAMVRTTRSDAEALDAMPFGAYAPQALWLDCEATPTAPLMTEAARFSTGLVHWWHPVGQPQLVIPARALPDARRHTAAGWRFAEHAYARLLGRPRDRGLDSPFPCTTESIGRT